jgi:isochorismate synthase
MAPFQDLRLAHRQLLEGAVIYAPDVSGVGPICFAGMRFDPAHQRSPEWRRFGAGLLLLPGLLFSRSPDGVWITANAVVPVDADTGALARRLFQATERFLAAPCGGGGGRRPEVLPEADARAHWGRAVARAIGAIDGGALDKVVLARARRLQADRPFDPGFVLHRLEALHPRCLVFAVALDDACFLGATPETMARLERGRVSSTCLAGTVPRGRDSVEDGVLADGLLASAKERREHALVVDAVKDALAGVCSGLRWDSEPRLLKLASVQHLETSFSGCCAPSAHVLDLVERLHPTPAVAGAPRDRALALIREVEGIDRGWYAGPIGIVDRRGDGEFAIALRCGLFQGNQAMLYAGAGIVAGSNPDGEWDETELKLEALQQSLTLE